jgi:NADH-quinone oxidoreductase subunit C
MMSREYKEEIIQYLQDNFPNAVLGSEDAFDVPNIEIQSQSVREILEFLKKDSKYAINFLTLIGAVHYPDNAGRELAVVYHLHSWTRNIRIRIKAFLPVEYPNISSVMDIYPCADWMERETYDFYGVIFEGHKNLKRILNEDSMDYFPMRKEYHLEDATREDKDDRYFGRFKNSES